MKIFTIMLAIVLLSTPYAASAEAAVDLFAPGGVDLGGLEESVVIERDQPEAPDQDVIIDDQAIDDAEVMLVETTDAVEDTEESSNLTVYLILAVVALVGGFAFGSMLKK